MELKEGMYVRTKKGIFQITNDKTFIENKIEYIGVNGRYTCIGVNTITKASYNIIDLIEVGDILKYVYDNKECVSKVLDRGSKMLLVTAHLEVSLGLVEIKSIVTKEQFESMEYSLEG